MRGCSDKRNVSSQKSKTHERIKLFRFARVCALVIGLVLVMFPNQAR